MGRLLFSVSPMPIYSLASIQFFHSSVRSWISSQLMVFLHRCLYYLHCLCKIPVGESSFDSANCDSNPPLSLIIGELFGDIFIFLQQRSGAPVSGRRRLRLFLGSLPDGDQPRPSSNSSSSGTVCAASVYFFLLSAARRALCGKINRIVRGKSRHNRLNSMILLRLLNQSGRG